MSLLDSKFEIVKLHNIVNKATFFIFSILVIDINYIGNLSKWLITFWQLLFGGEIYYKNLQRANYSIIISVLINEPLPRH
jgi:hypothetical protein